MVKFDNGCIIINAGSRYFTFPIENFYAITWLIGLFVLINGVIQIIYRRKAKALLGGNQSWIVFMGVVDILFGLLVILMLAQVQHSLFICLHSGLF